MTDIAMIGATGRMGRQIIQLLPEYPDLNLVSAVVSTQSAALGTDVGSLHGGAPVGIQAEKEVTCDVAVAIDFSPAGAVVDHLPRLMAMGAALVSGTTGMSDDRLKALRDASAQIPVLLAANMSAGVAVLSQILETAVAALPDADIEIVEAHHRGKVDAPSGTALALAERARRARDPETLLLSGRAGSARRGNKIGINAVRGGDVIGEHTVHLLLRGERIELTHRATSRDIFARGALRAARAIAGKPAGWYELEDLL